MKKILTLMFVVLCFSSSLMAQDAELFKAWSEKTIEKANTASNATFLNEDEKKVILYSNLARIDGPLFAETFLKQYLLVKEMKATSYTKSLFKDLQNVKDLPMLIPEKDLYNAAREHAIRSGKKGSEGHQGFKKRYTPLMTSYMEVGENIYYGKYTPIEIVIQLLIDENIEDLGHRKNLLNPKFNSLGVSIKPHRSYDYNCVMSFGNLPRSYEDYIQ